MFSVKSIAFAGLLCVAIPSVAESVDANTVGDLGKVQASTLMLKARLRELQARNDLKQAQAAGDGAPQLSTPQAATVLPNVKIITANEATLIYADGSTAAGGVGRKLPGGLTIKAISVASRTVDVSDAQGKPHTLPMSSTPRIAPVQTVQVNPSQVMAGGPMMGATPMMGGMAPMAGRLR